MKKYVNNRWGFWNVSYKLCLIVNKKENLWIAIFCQMRLKLLYAKFKIILILDKNSDLDKNKLRMITADYTNMRYDFLLKVVFK